MTWTMKSKPRTVKVTKAIAREFAEMEAAPRDRPLSERRLQVYQRILAKGGFRPVTWATASCKETGTTYRINGKHTSTMLSGLDKMPEFYAVIEEYECDTLDDVAHLYATFDSKIQSRTSSDINLSFAGTIPEISALAGKTINVAVAGMAWHVYQGRLSTTQPAERAEMLLEHTPFVIWLDFLFNQDGRRTTGERSSRFLQRQPVTGAMFATWQKDADAASVFWRLVRDETGESPETPDRRLAHYLITTYSTNGGGSRWGTRHGDSREMYVKSLHAWNAWRKGESTKLSYYPDKPLPQPA